MSYISIITLLKKELNSYSSYLLTLAIPIVAISTVYSNIITSLNDLLVLAILLVFPFRRLIAILFILLLSINMVCYITIKSPLTYELIETTWSVPFFSWIGFIQTYPIIKIIISVTAVLLTTVALYYICINLSAASKLILLILLIALTLHAYFKGAINPSDNNFYRLYSEYKQSSVLNNFRSYSLANAKSSSGFGNYLIIIGESTSKYHLESYGYRRETSPNLLALSQQNNVITFNNVITRYVSTASSLSDAFTLKPERYNLVDIINHHDFKTTWITNHFSRADLMRSKQLSFARLSHQVHTLNKKKFFSFSPAHDEIVLPQLQAELDDIVNRQSKKNVIFVHLKGTHFVNIQQTPNQYRKYPSKDLSTFTLTLNLLGGTENNFVNKVNQYDNLNIYNDYVVSEMFKMAQKAGFDGVLYFSDHGDEVFDSRSFYGHSRASPSQFMFEIPFIVYIKNPGRAEAFKKNIDKLYSQTDFAYTIIDLLNIEKNIDQTRSIFSPKFVEREVLIGNRSMNTFEKKVPWFEKVWLTNGEDTLKELPKGAYYEVASNSLKETENNLLNNIQSHEKQEILFINLKDMTIPDAQSLLKTIHLRTHKKGKKLYITHNNAQSLTRLSKTPGIPVFECSVQEYIKKQYSHCVMNKESFINIKNKNNFVHVILKNTNVNIENLYKDEQTSDLIQNKNVIGFITELPSK